MGDTSDFPTIRAISKGVVHRICSGQVILDLSSAVKELVENSLDAGASSIEIILKEHGAESFKVSDNGCGISPNNFKALAIKHHTSKLADFCDLQSLTTFGFRGEALSALCALGNLIVETRTKNESVGTRLIFDHSGIVTSETKTARQVGTTVTIEKLFSTLPVRCKEFSRNIRREYGKLISLLNAYALISKGIRFVCTNITKNSKSVLLKTQGSSSLKDNIINLFGLNTFQSLNTLDLSVCENCKIEGFLSKPGNGNGRSLGDRQFFYLNGRPVDMPKVSKLVNELYRCSNSKQYPIAIMNFIVSTRSYDINVAPDKRKVFLSDESSLMLSLRGAVEKFYSPNQCSYSINKVEESGCESDESETDSDTSLHGNESAVLTKPVPSSKGCELADVDDSQQLIMDDALRETMRQIPKKMVKEIAHKRPEISASGDFISSACKNSGTSSCQDEQDNDISEPHEKLTRQVSYVESQIKEEKAENTKVFSQSNVVQSSITKFMTVNKRKHDNNSTVISEIPVLRSEVRPCQVRKITPGIHGRIPSHHALDVETSENDANETLEDFGDPIQNLRESHGMNSYKKSSTAEDSENWDKAHSFSDMALKASPCEDLPDLSDPPMKISSETVDASPIKSCSVAFTSPILQFNINILRQRRLQSMAWWKLTASTKQSMKIRRCYDAATMESSHTEHHEEKEKSLAAATIELERLFRKQDFGVMKVVGQFNLGFIIAKLDEDLFVVDQHAADEKYNYEKLSQSTILKQQPLLRPRRLELSPEEEIVCSMHMEIIRKNGFCLIEDVHAAPGHRFLLKSVPFSKNITFGVEDVKELISALADSQEECSIMSSYKLDSSDSLCPSRVRAMLASRACHSSVTIGDPLAHNEMKKILQNLTKLKSPWNCPHGRPTMRHLVDLTIVRNKFRAGQRSFLPVGQEK